VFFVVILVSGPRFAMRARLLVVLLLPLIVLAQGYKPDLAASKMTTPADLHVSLVASEPIVRQPVAIDFDDQGRLWVMQYLQYPNPAGLKRVKVDRYSRTIYDRVPDPPPRGPRGDDRLTILVEKEGKVARGKDFVSGLNLASAFAFGHGGVFVLQVPYLLFYPDRNGDDVPDEDPDVLLTGFGMEDAHSVANSLTWGPDGWLYGCQGSTVTANICGIEFQQGVWRYHPLTRRFELFCEGGGNSWGLDFDRHGNLLYSTNHGGYVLLHGVQGGYYWKAFAKHGALHNPFAYGYFDHAPHTGFTGGHVTVGGLIYRGTGLPARFRDRYLGADLLGHNVYWHEIEAVGSTFRTRHAGTLLQSNDTWFAPCDVVMGPDGAVYVADWHDRRTAHPDPDAEWDKSNGRIYRIASQGTKPYTGGNLRTLSSAKLVELLAHPNDWFVRKARRILADRRDPEVIFSLREMVRTSKNEQLALEALWALHVSGGFNEIFAREILAHANPHLRRWTIRLLGDERVVDPALARQLARLAERNRHPTVRSQLASSAQRFPSEVALPIITAMVKQDVDIHDPHIPLLLWWALERHVLEALPDIVPFFASKEAWESTLARQVLHPRLVRRLAAAGRDDALKACAQLLASAPVEERNRLLTSLDEGFGERQGKPRPVPFELVRFLDGLWDPEVTDPTLTRLLMRLDRPGAHRKAIAVALQPRETVPLRTAMILAIAEFGTKRGLDSLVQLLDPREPVEIQLASLDAVARLQDQATASAILKRYPTMTGRLRTRARGILLGRPSWARAFIARVETKGIDQQEVSPEELQPLAQFGDAALDARIRKIWGNIKPPTPEEKLADIRRFNNDLRAFAGEIKAGQALFKKHCATCHKFHGEGTTIGPDLTHSNRKDRQFLLVSLVDPSAVIRKEYLAYTVQTTDGRVLTGLIVEETPGQVTIVDAKNEKTIIARNRIEVLKESSLSLMPDNLLKELKPQELRDLFAYLQADPKRGG
jgi:putative membrane-bound dehydrogenase-like protein